MPYQITIAHLQDSLGSKIHNVSDADRLITGITTDSRQVKDGEIFVALRGETFDGHQFVEVAMEKGAIAVIVDRPLSLPIPQLVVKDTLQAYQHIGNEWRSRFEIPIIAVTGSFGKTTTKELIAAVLSTQGKVHKTQGNYNNEIGVPKTLLQLESDHDFAVIEMAMRGLGQIALLTEITHPTIGVITNVGTAHIGLLGSQEAIATAKCELLAIMPKDSIAILNHDNPLLLKTAATVWQGETLTYGLDGGDLQGELINNHTLVVEGVKLPLPLPGYHNASNFLAALAVAKVLGFDLAALRTGVAVSLPKGRAQRYDLPNDLVILDETYNAGLESTLAALRLLVQTPGKRHIAILGTMKELGARSPQFHQQVGETARNLKLDALFVMVDDPEAEAIAQGAIPLPTECFTTQNDLVERLKLFVQPGDRLLFKASRAIGLDRVVDRLREQLGNGESGVGNGED